MKQGIFKKVVNEWVDEEVYNKVVYLTEVFETVIEGKVVSFFYDKRVECYKSFEENAPLLYANDYPIENCSVLFGITYQEWQERVKNDNPEEVVAVEWDKPLTEITQ